MILRPYQFLQVCLFVSWLWLAMAGCTQSETPLTSRENGFVDLYLLGKWHDLELNDQEQLVTGDLAYDISLADNGDLRVFQYGEKDTDYHEFSVYSSRLNGKKYINARLVACTGCSEQERGNLAANYCPYQIVQYATFLPRKLATHVADEVGDEVANALVELSTASRGQMIFMASMNSDFIKGAILDEAIAGDSNEDDAPCITSREDVLQQFLLQHDLDIYPTDGWGVLIRTSNL